VSYRYNNAFVKPGLNTLNPPTPTGFTYYLYAIGGENSSGDLALGNTTKYSSPKQVGSLTNWASINANSGGGHVVSTKTDNTLWAWGLNSSGQLGFGNRTGYSSPKQIGTLTNWKYASGGTATTVAIKTDGTLWSWGSGMLGGLGLGNTTSYSSPKQVGALTNWLKISVGINGSSLAIKTDGTLWSWGQNTSGQLGLGDTVNRSSPVQVGTLTNWKEVSSASASVMAIKTDGTLWAWGDNNSGQLGLGDSGSGTQRSSPVQVGTLTNWLKVAGGYYNVLAIKTDGTLWAWGRNVNGQLGLGDTSNRSSPVQVGVLTNWAEAAGGFHSIVVKTDGTIWGWGLNSNGQLGLNNITSYSSPKQIGALTTWYIPVCVAQNSLALQY